MLCRSFDREAGLFWGFRLHIYWSLSRHWPWEFLLESYSNIHTQTHTHRHTHTHDRKEHWEGCTTGRKKVSLGGGDFKGLMYCEKLLTRSQLKLQKLVHSQLGENNLQGSRGGVLWHDLLSWTMEGDKTPEHKWTSTSKLREFTLGYDAWRGFQDSWRRKKCSLLDWKLLGLLSHNHSFKFRIQKQFPPYFLRDPLLKHDKPAWPNFLLNSNNIKFCSTSYFK